MYRHALVHGFNGREALSAWFTWRCLDTSMRIVQTDSCALCTLVQNPSQFPSPQTRQALAPHPCLLSNVARSLSTIVQKPSNLHSLSLLSLTSASSAAACSAGLASSRRSFSRSKESSRPSRLSLARSRMKRSSFASKATLRASHAAPCFCFCCCCCRACLQACDAVQAPPPVHDAAPGARDELATLLLLSCGANAWWVNTGSHR